MQPSPASSFTDDPIACEFVSKTPKATQLLGEWFAKVLQAGDVLLLLGPLGAGKTCFVQGLAKGLGVQKDARVSSPSFALVHQYEAHVPVWHSDLYRLVQASDVSDLGLWEAAASGAIVVIEWADKFPNEWPKAYFCVEMSPETPTMRRLRVTASGETMTRRLREHVCNNGGLRERT